jgi:flagellar assembly factor FliW
MNVSDLIRFESRRVGPIEVPAQDILTFDPLPGFAGRSRFVVMEHADESALAWLVSLDDPDLAFVVADPWAFFPTYDPPVAREHLAALGIEKREEVEILCLVTLDGKSIHLNLVAPLLINVSSRKGLQVIGDDPRYTTRAPIPPLKAGATSEPSEESARPARGSVAPSP